MASFDRFKDIAAWQRARGLTSEIYQVSGRGEFSRDFGLKDQIRRASVSIMGNIAEGFGRGGDNEFIQFLSNARGSAREVQSHLYVALDNGYITSAAFDSLYALTDDASSLIAGLMRYLQQSESRGSKFRR